jgi:predicted nucleic acid-binding protein
VLSELRRKAPDAQVVRWMQERPAQTLFLSVLTLGEIRKGIEKLDSGNKKQTLLDWLELQLPGYFRGRLLNIDTPVADRWGRLMALAPRPLPSIDGLLAATAMQHDLTLVTRNTKDFQDIPGLTTLNPWQPQ